MEFKRQKLSHPSEPTVAKSTTTFLSINVDCMFKILNFLTIDDLCSVGETCSSLKSICGDYFSLKHPNKAIILDRHLIRNGKSTDRAVNCFQYYIKNMEARRYATDGYHNDDSRWNNYNLFDQIPKYSGGHLKNIIFRDVEFHKTFAAEMKNTLRDVESITFMSCEGPICQPNFYVKILEHCKNLTSLKIHDRHRNKLLHLLLARTFPMLNHIEFRYVKATETFTEKLKDFFSLNRIITFTWHFIFGSPSVSDKTFVKMVVENAIHLEELYISFDRYVDLSLIYEDLKALCNRKEFKRLEIKFNANRAKNILVQNGECLASLDALKGLHFDFAINPRIFEKLIASTENIKILQLFNVPKSRKYATISFEKFVNLEELIIRKLESLTFLQQFICYSPKLKKVLIIVCAISGFDFYIFSEETHQLFNKEREKLENACKLKIYTNDERYTNDECKMRSKPLVHNNDDLVKVKYAKFQNNFNVKPFVKWEIVHP